MASRICDFERLAGGRICEVDAQGVSHDDMMENLKVRYAV
jgi:hypothetical protein